MTAGLCRRLALQNLKKNYRFFLPRILTETGLIACFYIIYTLACDRRLASVKGGNYLPTFMWMGAVVTGLLSLILMFYTGSFLMRQRKREFGLYSVLGMEKKHICRVLLHESLLCTLLSEIGGLLCGMLFYKLASLAICRLLRTEIVAGFYFLKGTTVLFSGLVFLGIDLITFLINCISIGRMKPVELLTSARAGEKEPKVKWPLFVLGILTLGAGYYISLTTTQPLKAIFLFFAAVLLVIAGTYFLFVAGSIFVLKLLKKREHYYYRPGPFTAVSGLLFRMKQNAVGLASVAILATGVLVMISSTFCLYSRTETVLNTNYPQDYYVSSVFYDGEGAPVRIPEETLAEMVRNAASHHGLSVKETQRQEYLEVAYSLRGDTLITDRAYVSAEEELENPYNLTFMTEEAYIRLGGTPLGLSGNEVAVCPYHTQGNDPVGRSFLLDGESYEVIRFLSSYPINSALISVNCYGVVVADGTVYDRIFSGQREAYGPNASEKQEVFCVSFTDRDKTVEVGHAFSSEVGNAVIDYIESQGHSEYSTRWYPSYWEGRESLYGMYGTLLFLGVLLGLVCLFATVLILYYKQISEGYEDRERYQIMMKVGMTAKEGRKTVRTQVMLVFFLPLITAGVHIAFAYPILTRLMNILLLDDPLLFARWCVIVFAVFAAVYCVIYKLTEKTYCRIVF